MNAAERAAILAAESANLVHTIQLLHAVARAILASDIGPLPDRLEIRRLLEKVER